MSAEEIIAELPKLKPAELRLVKAKVDELAEIRGTTIFAGLTEDLRIKPDPVAALNFAKERGLETMRTDDWMNILREGEKD